MVLKIRFASGRRSVRTGRESVAFVVGACSLLQPVALAVWCTAGWRLGADLGWTAPFPITSGLLSQWQPWIALAFAIQFAAYLLQRFIPLPDEGEGSDDVSPRRSGMAA